MAKYEENHRLLSDLKGVPKNILDMSVAGANRNLKLSEYWVSHCHCPVYDFHITQIEIATKQVCHFW